LLFLSTNELLLESVSGAEGIELRLDLFPTPIDIQAVGRYLAASPLPVLLTLRSSLHGGRFQGSVEERLSILEECLRLKPPFLDLEADLPAPFLKRACTQYPETKIFLSSHLPAWESHLEPVYEAMAQYPAYVYKLAVPVASSAQAIDCLLLQQKLPRSAIIPMGKVGQFARILAPIVGTPLQFACLNETATTAPGQLTIAELCSVYRYPHLGRNTKLYGLIGSPVEQSLGAQLHNGWFGARGEDKLYVKITVEKEGLVAFLEKASQIGFQGLSVTLPLKEAVLPFLDEIDPVARKMGAVNTIVIRNGRKKGYNTDGKGALEAVEKRCAIQGKTVVILGAGGVARAIAFEAKRRGARVVLMHRILEKGQQVARELGCGATPWGKLPNESFLLINGTPEGEALGPVSWAMDVVYRPKETPFLSRMRELGAEVIHGEEMFVNQAREQASLWRAE
jgi:3-dehydroquinate dehydratase/shikimate dehydrogenase